MIVNLIDYLKERLQAVKQVCYGIIAVIFLWSAIAVDTHHAHTWIEKIPGFWSLFGLISCVVLIFFATWFGRSGIQTREDYYDN
jgi:4-hydroxybenzoate polyprenyltransferase